MSLFDTSDFMARWQCGAFDGGLGWCLIMFDVVTGLCYIAIPAVIYWVSHGAHKRFPFPFRSLSIAFIAFILICGLNHFVEASMFEWPAYRFYAMVKFAMALVSVTAVALLASRAHDILEYATAHEALAEARRIEARLRKMGLWERR